MNEEIFYGLMIPFIGTVLGLGCVFFLRKGLSESLQKALSGFAAGAMMYVVVEELVPEMSGGNHSHLSVLMFTFGFTLMMALDVALG